MKTSILAATALGGFLLALPAAAQTAAASLPNAFEEAPPAARGPQIAAAPAPAAMAPDVARAEQALRAAILAFQSGQVDYSVFSPNLATQIHAEAAELAPRVKAYGGLKSIAFVGQQDGAALFRVVFANQATDWVIAFDENDLINGLLFRPARD